MSFVMKITLEHEEVHFQTQKKAKKSRKRAKNQNRMNRPRCQIGTSKLPIDTFSIYSQVYFD